MREVVVDASVALAWGFPDEASEYADTVLAAIAGQQILVPAVWTLEITNAIAVAQRRKRINVQETQRFIELLAGLNIKEVPVSLAWSASNILPLAVKYNLSAYDAAYLALAVRHSAPLATLDIGLSKAAKKSDIEIWSEIKTSKHKT